MANNLNALARETLFAHASRLARAGDYNGAERVLRGVVDGPGGARVEDLFLLGKIYFQAGRVDEALECMDRALGLDPGSPDVVSAKAAVERSCEPTKESRGGAQTHASNAMLGLLAFTALTLFFAAYQTGKVVETTRINQEIALAVQPIRREVSDVHASVGELHDSLSNSLSVESKARKKQVGDTSIGLKRFMSAVVERNAAGINRRLDKLRRTVTQHLR
jgi:tetratricopeptide (TPR) repeat protein